MMNTKFLATMLLLMATTLSAASLQESLQVQALQKSIKDSIKMDFSNYKLYPFALALKQHFVLSYEQAIQIKGQININWIDAKQNSLQFPTYLHSEFVKVTIFDATINKTIQQRKFHFQTGIKFKAQAGHRYNLIFTDYGIKNKMVELAISKVQSPKFNKIAEVNNTAESVMKALQMTKQIYKQLSRLEVKQKKQQSTFSNVYDFINASLVKFCYFSLWEISLVVGIMICQIFLLNKAIKCDWEFL